MHEGRPLASYLAFLWSSPRQANLHEGSPFASSPARSEIPTPRTFRILNILTALVNNRARSPHIIRAVALRIMASVGSRGQYPRGVCKSNEDHRPDTPGGYASAAISTGRSPRVQKRRPFPARADPVSRVIYQALQLTTASGLVYQCL